jgi:hypothetical protein
MAALRRDETSAIHTKNLVIPTSYFFEQRRAGEELFATCCILERHAWLAGVFVSASRLWSCA